MDEKTRFVVGIDVGTSAVRAVMGELNQDNIAVVGYGEEPVEGIRRGVVVDINAPIPAIDRCLATVEKMSGVKIESAAVSINGANLASTKVDGMIAVGVADHEVNEDDLARIEEAALAGKASAQHEILNVLPYEYRLDGQGGIREPLGMKGARLEMRANVISAMKLECDNLARMYEQVNVGVRQIEPAVLAAARAVLTGPQKENGVAVIEMGAATTSIAIFDEGELQYVGVYPRGGNDVTNDLAAYLQTVPDVAEEIKLRFVTGNFGESDKDVVIKRGREEMTFKRKDVDEVVESRLEEIFEVMRKHLKRAGYDRQLPEGVILTGGAAKLKDIDIYARTQLELAVRIGKPQKINGVSEDVKKPEYAAAVGLMFVDRDAQDAGGYRPAKVTTKKKKGGGGLKKFFGAFK